MEARLAKVEAAVESLTKHYATSEAVARLEGKVDSLEHKLDAKMANLQSSLIRWMVASVLAAGGLAFALARFLQ